MYMYNCEPSSVHVHVLYIDTNLIARNWESLTPLESQNARLRCFERDSFRL